MKGYLFDYGGTLDTAGCHWGKFIWHGYERCLVPVAWEDFREVYVLTERKLGKGEDILPSFTFRKTLETKLRMQLSFLRERQALPQEYQAEEALAALLDDLYGEVRRQMDVSRQVLRKLSERAPVALVSNFYGNLPTVVEEMRIADCFQTVVESAAVGIRKPAPQLFQLALERLGLQAEETIVVGDSLKNDILPARSLGCQAAWLKGEGWNNDDYTPPAGTREITSLTQLVDNLS